MTELDPVPPQDLGVLRLIVGLGNPGARYSFTRHNIGFFVIDHLVQELGAKSRRFPRGELFVAQVDAEPLWLLKPNTYMNRSGLAVVQAALEQETYPDEILVIHDDIDLPLGRLRVRCGGGSSGGHKGILSIQQHLKSPDFPRLKLGIGRPQGQPVPDYVLSTFDDSEADLVEKVVAHAAAAALLSRTDLAAAMNRYNGLDLAEAGQPDMIGTVLESDQC